MTPARMHVNEIENAVTMPNKMPIKPSTTAEPLISHLNQNDMPSFGLPPCCC